MSKTRKWIGILAIAALSVLGVILAAVMFLTQSAQPRPTAPLPTTTMPPTSVAAVDEILKHLEWGNVAFSAPRTIRYDEPVVVELLVSPSLSAAELEEQLRDRQGVGSARIQIANRMTAQLSGEGFTIKSLTPDVQVVASQEPTRWRWNVLPIESGKRELHVALSALIDVSGREAPLVVKTYDHAIQVEVTVAQRFSQFVGANWQWLWGTLLVPAAAYAWKRWKDRRASSAPAQSVR